MTTNSFFYEAEDGGVVRVEADSFEQVTSQAQVGQCPVDYVIQVTVTRYHNGRLAAPNQVYSGDRRFRGPIADVYITDNLRDVYVSHNNGQQTDLNSGSNFRTRLEDLRDVVIARHDGQPDDCGGAGGCVTTFYLGTQAIHSLDYCPDISENPPTDECADCCRGLLPIARSITV